MPVPEFQPSSPDRIRILILSTNSDEAGAPIHVESVIRALGAGIDFLAVFGEEGPVSLRLAAMGVKVAVVSSMRSRIDPIRDFRSFRAISGLVREFRPHLVHAHSSKAGMLGRLIGLRHQIPTIYTVHGWGWRGLGFGAAIAVRLVERALKAVPYSTYIYVSRSVADEAEAVLKIPRSRGTVVHNGVGEVGSAIGSGGVPTIVMAARISTAKDHESLVRAFEDLGRPSRLVLCGTGTDELEFAKKIRIWAPHRFADVMGLGQRSDMHEILKRADIFALISNFEALPLSIIEAMSAGLPVVATDVGGIPELIEDRENGLLVDKGNVDQIRAALTTLLDADERVRLGRNARSTYFSGFTIERMAEKLLGIYLDVLRK